MLFILISEIEIPYFENFDLTSIITPVNAQMLGEMLLAADYDKKETAFLVQGFTRRFVIGYAGPEHRQSEAHNIPLRPGVGDVEYWID